MPGLVAFWTFGEDAGQPRLSVGTKNNASAGRSRRPDSARARRSIFRLCRRAQRQAVFPHSLCRDGRSQHLRPQRAGEHVRRRADREPQAKPDDRRHVERGQRGQRRHRNAPIRAAHEHADLRRSEQTRPAHQQRRRRHPPRRRQRLPLVRRLRRHGPRSADREVVHPRLHLRRQVHSRLSQRRAR